MGVSSKPVMRGADTNFHEIIDKKNKSFYNKNVNKGKCNNGVTM